MATAILFSYLLSTVIFLFYIVTFAFIIWMLIDAGKQDKFWWMVLILGLPIVGALVYYFTEKKHDYMKIPEAKKEK